jgi:hypothetical protein
MTIRRRAVARAARLQDLGSLTYLMVAARQPGDVNRVRRAIAVNPPLTHRV